MQIPERVASAARRRGLLLLTGNAAVNGIDGDTLMIAPPHIISKEEIDIIVEAAAQALAEVYAQIERDACHNDPAPTNPL